MENKYSPEFGTVLAGVKYSFGENPKNMAISLFSDRYVINEPISDDGDLGKKIIQSRFGKNGTEFYKSAIKILAIKPQLSYDTETEVITASNSSMKVFRLRNINCLVGFAGDTIYKEYFLTSIEN